MVSLLAKDTSINKRFAVYIGCADNNEKVSDSINKALALTDNAFKVVDENGMLFSWQSRKAIKVFLKAIDSEFSDSLKGNFGVPLSIVLSKENNRRTDFYGLDVDFERAKEHLLNL